jgi:hypothetical protein
MCLLLVLLKMCSWEYSAKQDPRAQTTLGIPILILLLRVTTALVSYTPMGQPPESIKSGNYGTPPKAWWWFKQSLIYFCGLMGMKICVLILFMMLPLISRVGDWALSWTDGNEKLQIVFSMMLFPLIMNGLQYYIIDSFIKLEEPGPDGQPAAAGRQEDGVVYAELSGSEGIDDEGLDDEDAGKKASSNVRASNADDTRDVEYDPDVDGDSQTVIGSGSSAKAGVLPKNLVPHE